MFEILLSLTAIVPIPPNRPLVVMFLTSPTTRKITFNLRTTTPSRPYVRPRRPVQLHMVKPSLLHYLNQLRRRTWGDCGEVQLC